VALLYVHEVAQAESKLFGDVCAYMSLYRQSSRGLVVCA